MCGRCIRAYFEYAKPINSSTVYSGIDGKIFNFYWHYGNLDPWVAKVYVCKLSDIWSD